jgi:uncharacterized protein (DUF302 family)
MDEPATERDDVDGGRSRRAFMSDATLVGAGAAALGVVGSGVAAANDGSNDNGGSGNGMSDVGILNYALTVEHLEAAYYNDFLDNYSESEVEGSEIAQYFARPTLQYSVYQQIQDVRDHEEAHVDALTKTINDLGGTPVEPANYEFPYSSIEEFVTVADRLEAVGVSAYAGVAPMIDSDEVLEAALSIHSVEANHQTYFQLLNLQRPAPNAFNPARSMDEVRGIANQFIVGEDGGGNGLVTATSDASVSATVERIKRMIRKKGLKSIATVDHAANADSVGMDLRPTTLLIFGSPAVGTPLMQASQSTGIDLPQKMLVYEDESGQTNVVYNSPDYLAARHDITGQDDRLEKIATVLEALAGGEVDRSKADSSGLFASGDGIVTVSGGGSVESTVSRIQKTLESNSAISLVTTVDHAANADSVGMELRPTTLLVFGNPQLGTPLMQASRTIGIDLPQKLLVYEDGSGNVTVAYNDPQYLAERHGITAKSELLSTIEGALRSIATGGGDDSGGEGELSVAGLSADADGTDANNLNDEYITYENTGNAPLDLSGWTVTDDSGTTYTFPDGFMLEPGAQVTLYTGSGTNTDTELYWGQASEVWNNGADTMTVENADGRTVLQRSYP